MTAGEPHPGAADAAAQLAALRSDREALADRVVQPWWHDVAAGLLLFGFLASRALGSTGVTLVAAVLFAAGLGWLAWTYRRRTGVWVTPDARAWVTWVSLALLVLVPAMVLQDHGQGWAMVAAGAVLGVALAGLSRWWSRRWVAELRGES
ncbi:hypothetical protein ACU610_22550 [Geodermatophilus sp. URMC 61]|uniref:hypothetical protein n=1 Tax=Geodermatophilus sp. URMC 61 TaxID=3423411 RepID=UPI00406CC62B